jgi:hypothetical protein
MPHRTVLSHDITRRQPTNATPGHLTRNTESALLTARESRLPTTTMKMTDMNILSSESFLVRRFKHFRSSVTVGKKMAHSLLSPGEPPSLKKVE